MRAVVDTNVVISALLKPGSVPDLALRVVLDEGALLWDARIEAEYRRVCWRDKFRAVPRDRITELLARITERAEAVAPAAWSGAMTDEDDRVFIEVALGGGADAIVTGNARHFPDDVGVRVLPPAALLELTADR